MKKSFLLGGIFVLSLWGTSCQQPAATADYRIVPCPQQIDTTANKGESFVLNSRTKIVYPEGNEKMGRNAQFLSEYISKMVHLNLQTTTEAKDNNVILLQTGLESDNPEAYSLKVTPDQIIIQGASEAGTFYGIQTLRKTLPASEKKSNVEFPSATIEDSPRFGYRGAHFDVARHFFTIEEVKEYINMMALHNMNRLHWHITDDQGWRIEIKKYPKLTEVGSQREETLIGHASERPERFDGKPYGGFYTQEEAKEIVAYAAERYITVIPEVDLPGHMQAALTAYPELGCTGGPYKVWTKWGISEEVLCAGNDKALQFLDDVFTEIMQIFPAQYIHIGGDECPKVRWEKCPKCQARIKAEGIRSDKTHTKEQYLQTFVMQHVASFLEKHGRKIIGWDEMLEGNAIPGATIMSWRGEKGGIQAAQSGHDVIMTPNTYLYFDYMQSKDKENEPLGIGGYIPVKKVYEYSPIPESLSVEESKHIIGVQANLWTEYIATFDHVQYMVLPRWAALSENQWTCSSHKNYRDFLNRLEALMRVYKAEGYNFAKHVLSDPDFPQQPQAEEME